MNKRELLEKLKEIYHDTNYYLKQNTLYEVYLMSRLNDQLPDVGYSIYMNGLKNLKAKQDKKIYDLCMKYVNENKRFNVGDIIKNPFCMIEINEITYELDYNNIEIIYSGHQVVKFKNKYHKGDQPANAKIWDAKNVKKIIPRKLNENINFC